MEKKDIPRRRFKGFDEAWGEKRLDDISSISAGGDIDRKKVSNEGKYPIIANTFENKGIIGYYKDWYKVKAPAVTVTGRGDVGFATARFNNFTPVIRLLVIKSKLDVYFLEQVINNKTLVNESTGVPQLTSPQLGRFVIEFPTIEEQQKIGEFFKILDERIANQERKIAKVKSLKDAYLTEMFPQEGETVPKKRFKGFGGEWECELFENVLKVHPFKTYLAQPQSKGKYEVVQQGDNPIIGYSDARAFNEFRNVVLFGDHTLSLFRPTNPFLLATDGVKILEIEKMPNEFLFVLLSVYIPKAEGYKRHFTILKNQFCFIPKSVKEQQKIGAFFKNLDNQIEMEEKKLDKFQKMKEAYLEEMFV